MGVRSRLLRIEKCCCTRAWITGSSLFDAIWGANLGEPPGQSSDLPVVALEGHTAGSCSRQVNSHDMKCDFTF